MADTKKKLSVINIFEVDKSRLTKRRGKKMSITGKEMTYAEIVNDMLNELDTSENAKK